MWYGDHCWPLSLLGRPTPWAAPMWPPPSGLASTCRFSAIIQLRVWGSLNKWLNEYNRVFINEFTNINRVLFIVLYSVHIQDNDVKHLTANINNQHIHDINNAIFHPSPWSGHCSKICCQYHEVLRYYGRRGPKLLWRCSGQKLLWGRSIPQQHRRLGTRVPNHWAYCRGMRDLATQESISNCSSWDLIFRKASWEII